jgi:prevent-host-death family protein
MYKNKKLTNPEVVGEANLETREPVVTQNSAQKVEITELRSSLSETINQVAYGKERVIITRHGKAVAVLVPIEDALFLEELEDRVDLETARAAMKAAEAEETVPWKQIKEGLGL